jgi:hypothetical protein
MRSLGSFLGTVFLAVAALGVWSDAWGQSATTGELAGTVQNASGIRGVVVALTNSATNQARTAETDGSGNYRLSLLPPGSYEIRFSSPGFKAAWMTAVVVNVSEVTVVDATLEPGNPGEQVTCRCRVSNTSSATGTLLDNKTITAVPLNTRNLTQVMSLSSGSAADVNNAGTLGRGTQSINVNGNTNSGTYTVDGAYASSATPNPDTISEFKIQTSQYDALYGAQVPSTNLITKSGENNLHGNLWEFVRNDVFNANSFFRNATGQPKPNLKQNQFGATFGAPIRKNRLFLFGSFQGTRQTNGLDPTSVSNVILPPLTRDRSAAALAALFCPDNHRVEGQSKYLTFAGGKQLDCRNESTAATAPINPVALRILQAKLPDGSYLVPLPQTIVAAGGNAGLGFSSYSFPSTYDENQYVASTDYVLSRKHTLSGRTFLVNIDQYRSFGSPNGGSAAPYVPTPGTSQSLTAQDYIGTVKLTSALTTQIANEARMSFTRTNQVAMGVNTPSAASLGMTAADPVLGQLPEITVLGSVGSFRLFGTTENDFTRLTDTYSWSDNLSWVHGRHNIRTGLFLLTQFNNRLETGAARGKITFQTFNDFLLGLSAADNLSPYGRSNIQSIQANEGVGPNGELQTDLRSRYGAGYVQDDFKVSSRLTLNLGLRWEYIGAASERNGTNGNAWFSLLNQVPIPPASGTLVGNTVAANYNGGLINPYTGKAFGPPPTGVFVRPNNSLYQNSTPLDKFAPRFGFAWAPYGAQGRVTLRGGYGWFYQASAASGIASGATYFTPPPFARGYSNADASNNLSEFTKPFPDTTLGYVLRTPTSQLSDRIAGPIYEVPLLQQWNLTAQLRLARTIALDIGYVGSHGSNLLMARGRNQPRLAGGANPVNCGYDGIATDCVTTNTSRNANLRVSILGETPTALSSSEYIGSSTYNSLQATLRKQVSHGLSFQAAYTFSRAATNTVVFNDPDNLALDWARATFDRTHRLIANFDYQLPTPFKLNGAISSILKGWSVTGIVIVQSGLPLTLTDPNGGSVFGRAATSTVTLCPDATYGSLATSGSIRSRLNGWINTAAICAPAAIGADGSTGYGNTGQGILSGPGQVNTDFSLGKTFRTGGFHENAVLAFRMELYNALNSAQFANPGTTFRTSNFGVITQTSVAPRLIQFALKYLF